MDGLASVMDEKPWLLLTPLLLLWTLTWLGNRLRSWAGSEEDDDVARVYRGYGKILTRVSQKMGAALEAIFVGLMAFFALGLAYVLLMASWRGAQQLGEGERPDALIIPGLLIVYLLATLLLGKDNPWRRHRRGGE